MDSDSLPCSSCMWPKRLSLMFLHMGMLLMQWSVGSCESDLLRRILGIPGKGMGRWDQCAASSKVPWGIWVHSHRGAQEKQQGCPNCGCGEGKTRVSENLHLHTDRSLVKDPTPQELNSQALVHSHVPLTWGRTVYHVRGAGSGCWQWTLPGWGGWVQLYILCCHGPWLPNPTGPGHKGHSGACHTISLNSLPKVSGCSLSLPHCIKAIFFWSLIEEHSGQLWWLRGGNNDTSHLWWERQESFLCSKQFSWSNSRSFFS